MKADTTNIAMAAQRKPISNQAKMQHISTASFKPIPKTTSYLPTKRNETFAGRHQLLTTLKTNLSAFSPPQVSSTPVVFLHGPKGVGKTEIVKELAHQVLDKHPQFPIFWVNARDFTVFSHSYREIANTLGILKGLKEADDEVLKAVKDHLEASNAKWLLILDQADDEALWLKSTTSETSKTTNLTGYLPNGCQNGSILATTSNATIADQFVKSIGKGLSLPVHAEMEECDAIELFKRHLERAVALETLERDIKVLLERLCYFPLSIVQAAAYINTNRITVTEYIGIYSQVQELSTEDEEFTETASSCFERTSRLAWFISQRQMNDKSVEARLLTHMAILSIRHNPMAGRIPAYLLPVANTTDLSQLESQARHRNAIRLLESLGFIKLTERSIPGGCLCPDCSQGKLVDYYQVDQRVADATLKILREKPDPEAEIYELTQDLAQTLFRSPHSSDPRLPTDSHDTENANSIPLSETSTSEPTEATATMFYAWLALKRFFFSTKDFEKWTWLRDVRESIENKEERIEQFDKLNTIFVGPPRMKLVISNTGFVGDSISKLTRNLVIRQLEADHIDGRLTADEEAGAGFLRRVGEFIVSRKLKGRIIAKWKFGEKLYSLVDSTSEMGSTLSWILGGGGIGLGGYLTSCLSKIGLGFLCTWSGHIITVVGVGVTVIGFGLGVKFLCASGVARFKKWYSNRQKKRRAQRSSDGCEGIAMVSLLSNGKMKLA